MKKRLFTSLATALLTVSVFGSTSQAASRLTVPEPLNTDDAVQIEVALRIIGNKDCGDLDIRTVWLEAPALKAYAEEKEAAGGAANLTKAGIAWTKAGEREKATSIFSRLLADDPNNLSLFARLADAAPGGIGVYAFGKAVPFTDVLPQIMNGRTMVPVRAVTETLGAKVEWNNETHTATFTLNGKEVQITEGSNVARINGMATKLDVTPIVLPPGRFVVPLRLLSESFGFDVKWFSAAAGNGVVSIRQRAQ